MPTWDDLPLVLTVEQVAEVLQVSKRHAYEAIRLKQIPHRKLGKRIVVPRELLRRWLEGDDGNG